MFNFRDDDAHHDLVTTLRVLCPCHAMSGPLAAVGPARRRFLLWPRRTACARRFDGGIPLPLSFQNGGCGFQTSWHRAGGSQAYSDESLAACRVPINRSQSMRIHPLTLTDMAQIAPGPQHGSFTTLALSLLVAAALVLQVSTRGFDSWA